MDPISLEAIVPVIQVSVGPVVLISGVGLLILAFANQFGRIVDRTRKLNSDYMSASDNEKKTIIWQTSLLWKRARCIRLSLFFSCLCLLFVTVLIISLFIINLFSIANAFILIIFFVISLLSLTTALCFFIVDIQLSLQAVRLGIRSSRGEDPLNSHDFVGS